MRTSTAGSCNRSAGFTLIELVVVVVLISMFAVASVSLVINRDRGELSSSARRLAGVVKYLFNEAALSGLEQRLIFNLDDGSYRAQVLDTNGYLYEAESLGRQAQLSDGVSFTDVTTGGRGNFSFGEVTVRIYPSGWLEETVVHLSAGQGEALTLRVNSLTGSTEIYSGYRSF
jgi:general secretion pathway protein H